MQNCKYAYSVGDINEDGVDEKLWMNMRICFWKKPIPPKPSVYCSDCKSRSVEKLKSIGGDLYYYCLHSSRLLTSTDYIENTISKHPRTCDTFNLDGKCELFEQLEKKKLEEKKKQLEKKQ